MNNSITFLISSLAGGGAEKISVALANSFQLNKRKVEFIVLNLKNEIYYDDLNPKIKKLSLHSRHARTSFFPLIKYILKNNPDKFLVFNHELALVLVLLKIILFKNFKIYSRNISTLSKKLDIETSIWHGYFKKNFLKLLYNKVDKIIAQSEGMKDDLINNFNLSKRKIEVIYNPYTTNKVSSSSITTSTNEEILYIGRLEKIKGLNYLLEAFTIVLNDHPNLKLRIVGQGSLFSILQKDCENKGITKKVIFEGFKKETAPFFENAKLTILTSLYEGFPNVLVESITYGTPVVSFDCKSGPSEIIEDGINGFLVNYLDIDDLVEKISKTLNYKWDKSRIIESSKRFSLDNAVSKYLRICNT